MKKTFIFGLMLVFSMSIFAQKEVINNQKTPITVKKYAKIPAKKVVLKYSSDSKDAPVGVPIGMTNYDLQSNSAVATRIINHEDGTISAVWLQDQSDAPGGSTRGTGYNYFDGTSWKFTSTSMSGNERIENTKTGWPAIMSNGTVDFVANHFNGSTGLFGWTQNKGVAATGWTSADIAGGEAMLWPRGASAGDNFYVVAVDNFTTGTGVEPDIEGLHFFKSTDAGASWTYKGLMPDFSTYYAYGNGDQYAIDAVDSIVAVVYFGSFSDTRLWKSVDYGETWTQEVINDFPVDDYSAYGGVVVDMDNDGVADTCTTTDNIGDVIIDNNGEVHVVFGRMRVLQEDASAGSSIYFPYTDDLLYWNESMGEGAWDNSMVQNNAFDLAVPDAVDTIAYSFDLNGNNIIWEFADVGADEFPFGTYYSSITSFPSLGIDADNNIYCAFTTVMEGDNYVKTDATPNAQSYRGAWVIARTATDSTWQDPLCISDVDGTNAENMFPTMARNVDEHAHIWLQWDNEPGLHIRGDEDAVTDNYIIYKSIAVADLLPAGIDDITAKNINISVYPNPATDLVTVNNVKDATITVYNTLGAVVETIESSDNNATINMSNYAIGTYIIKAVSENGIGTVKVVKSK